MLTSHFSNFYANWSQKYDNIVGQDISSLFERYITLYIMYNSLYSNVPPALIARGVYIRPNVHESVLATRLVIRLIGADNLLNNLYANGADVHIDALINIIRTEQFYINLRFGQRQRNEDLLILDKLTSINIQQKAAGLLEVIYHVRCNLIHGNKNFNEPQRILLNPLIIILSMINRQLYEILDQ